MPDQRPDHAPPRSLATPDGFGEPRDDDACPPRIKAADGVHTLQRFRVDAVIYAPTRREAVLRLRNANLHLDAGAITPRSRRGASGG